MPYWLFLIIGLSLFFAFMVTLYNSNWKYMFTSIPIFIGLVMFFALPFLDINANNPHYSQRYTEDTPIYSLRTSDQVVGSFTLGSGTIGEKTFYVYYTRDNDGAYSINKVDSSQCKIYMDRNNDGILTRVWGKIDNDNLSKHWGWEETIFSHYELHLPVGSIVQEYNVR